MVGKQKRRPRNMRPPPPQAQFALRPKQAGKLTDKKPQVDRIALALPLIGRK